MPVISALPAATGPTKSTRRKLIGAMALLLLLLPAASAWAATTKEAMHDEMNALAIEIRALKPNVADPGAGAEFEAKLARYSQLSQVLGGDDPGHLLGGSASGALAAPALRPKVVPSTPAGCGPATATFTQSTPVVIPTTAPPNVVTSTVVVSGTGPFLFDLDVTTNITHTFDSDLDITLTSPGGTIVTLTTDNGGTFDNAYNGTLWDDDADPDGLVPYTTNNGMVTDHAYVNLTLASPLVVEEALSPFIGENPNGTWTLTISDDANLDGGNLASWSLAVTTFPSPPLVATVPTATNATPVVIPTTAPPNVVTSTIVIAGAGTPIFDVDVTTSITHSFDSDLDITLTSPAGTIVTLTTDNGGTFDNAYNGTVWDDDADPDGVVPYTTNNGMVTDHSYVNLTLASPLVVEEALAAFIGEDPNGTWTLTISDDANLDGGSLNSWSLDIDTFGCASADLSITKTDGVTTATPGGSVTYTIVAANAGPTAANPASVTDTFPAACTSVSYTSVAAGGATGNTAGPAAGNINDVALNLPAGSSVTYTATCTISPAAVGTLDNTATVSSSTPDPNGTNNSATDSDTLGASADLSLTKTAAPPGSVNVGSNVVYTLTVTNNGPSNATGVTVTDPLPAGVTYVSNDCGATFLSPTVTWNVGSLLPAASATCNITVTVAQAGPIVNIATATGNEADPTPGNNAANVTVLGVVVAIPTLSELALLLLGLAMAAVGIGALRRQS